MNFLAEGDFFRRETPPARHLFEMLCFVHNEGAGATVMQALFEDLAQVRSRQCPFNEELPPLIPMHPANMVGNLGSQHGFVRS
jgi:hypothetical protein